VAPGGVKEPDETWDRADATDDVQDDHELAAAIESVAAAGGGALSLARELPDGGGTRTTLAVQPPNGVDHWEVRLAARARLFDDPVQEANRELLLDAYTGLARATAPYAGHLASEHTVRRAFDGDFTGPPPYFTGVTYLSERVPGVDVDAVAAGDAAHDAARLPDGVVFEACGAPVPWRCSAEAVADLERLLGIEYLGPV